MALALEVRRLTQQDLCSGFVCGHIGLEAFFRQYAKQHERRRTSSTFVACAEGTIVGFATIVPGSTEAGPLKPHVGNLANHPAPVLVLARMATHSEFRKQGIGERLLRDAVFQPAIQLADGFGCVGVHVDAKPESVAFYSKYDFKPLAVDVEPLPMFLPLAAVVAAMKTW